MHAKTTAIFRRQLLGRKLPRNTTNSDQKKKFLLTFWGGAVDGKVPISTKCSLHKRRHRVRCHQPTDSILSGFRYQDAPCEGRRRKTETSKINFKGLIVFHCRGSQEHMFSFSPSRTDTHTHTHASKNRWG